MTRPPFESFPELVSSRIRLRQFLPEDADRIIDVTFFQRIPAKDAADVVVMLGKIDERYRNGEGIHWGIQEVSTGEFIGCCGFYRGFANETGEVGYFLKEQFRNKGYMSEAVQLLLEFGFRKMQLKKIFAVTAQSNLASQTVLRKNGFISAGTVENGDLRFHLLP